MKDVLRIHAADGYPISVTGFLPKKPNGNVILINSATGVRQKFYEEFASTLSGEGFRVFTYDYRGIGNSRPSTLKGFEASMHQWGTLDYHAVLKYLFLTYTDCQFTVVGHSVGGQIIGLSPLSENVDKIVTIGAQVPYQREFGGGLQSLKLTFFWRFMIPVFTKLFGYFPASNLGLFEDLPAGVAREWASWSRNRNYLFDQMPWMKARFNSLHQEALMISFTDDTYAPKKAVESLMNYYGNVRWNHSHVSPQALNRKKIGHFGFFRGKVASSLWTNIQQWMIQPRKLAESKAA